MNDNDFERWLIREEAGLKIEKELDDWCENDVFVDELYKRYRQLQKAITAYEESQRKGGMDLRQLARETAEKVIDGITEKVGLEPVVSPLILSALDKAVVGALKVEDD